MGHIKDIRVLGYADDVVMMEKEVEDMTTRLTVFADDTVEQADMKIKLSKTNSQLLDKRQEPTVTTEQEIENKKTVLQACLRICNSWMQEVIQDEGRDENSLHHMQLWLRDHHRNMGSRHHLKSFWKDGEQVILSALEGSLVGRGLGGERTHSVGR